MQKNMEPLQNVQEYNANNFASALTLENVTNSIYSSIRENLIPSCIYITLFITSFVIIDILKRIGGNAQLLYDLKDRTEDTKDMTLKIIDKVKNSVRNTMLEYIVALENTIKGDDNATKVEQDTEEKETKDESVKDPYDFKGGEQDKSSEDRKDPKEEEKKNKIIKEFPMDTQGDSIVKSIKKELNDWNKEVEKDEGKEGIEVAKIIGTSDDYTIRGTTNTPREGKIETKARKEWKLVQQKISQLKKIEARMKIIEEEEEKRNASELMKPKIIEKKKQKIVVEVKPKVISQIKPKIIEDKKSKTIEPAKPKALEPVKPKTVEPIKRKAIEGKKSKIVEEAKGKVLEEKKPRAIEDKKHKEIEDKQPKKVVEKKSKTIEETRPKKIEEKECKENTETENGTSEKMRYEMNEKAKKWISGAITYEVNKENKKEPKTEKKLSKQKIKKSLNKLRKDYDNSKDDEYSSSLTEEWKINERDKWMQKLDEEWTLFKLSMENKVSEWLKEKDKDWESWRTQMKNKWMHYNENMDAQYNTNVYKECHMWDETGWKTWIKANGKKLLETDWINWVNESEWKLNELFNYEWSQWKYKKLFEWEMSDWKCEESDQWYNWQQANLAKWLQKKKKKKYRKWKVRIRREKEEWDQWVYQKELLNSKFKMNLWLKWKNDKHSSFNDWVESFIKEWISSQQWNVWLTERRNSHSKRSILTN
ncbi:tryptophan-rich antigen (Pv-fam-a) [Plasmodium ovale wallikeri]|uniref:Tryptophan-rich antigen (Pv-fam-a) n=1 Tax=Plasmodium ovale wallikeri TaxID=864142 RepID=A0A1A9A3R0_PLAOA|nr:tryptophan-rich antigen (Pv-fam-a) [Plasmodium ovale wallikeri]SBT51083.1 tryptophan-rich antigen (Pv-fam-a) [Plasmodium ovale wallikeri]